MAWGWKEPHRAGGWGGPGDELRPGNRRGRQGENHRGEAGLGITEVPGPAGENSCIPNPFGLIPGSMEIAQRLKSALADRYQVGELVGEGGMAQVFLARDLKHHRSVAIKVLRPELSATLGPDRFLREIEIAAGLNHPNILAVHDSGEADGLLYFVMPLVEGESLRHRLAREGPLALEETIEIATEVGDALEYAHQRGLVHRDIKPENILFQAGHALVTDFGVAKATTAAGERLTRTGMAVGTFTYMSPEQLMGDGVVDQRSDVYALGCLVAEMLSGEAPFAAATPQASLTRKLTGEVEDLAKGRPDVPPTVRKAIRGALAAEADARYGTTSAFVTALETANTTAAVEADARRRKRRTGLRTVAGLVGVGLLATAAWWVSSMAGGPAMARIAVLPLGLEPPDTSREYLVAGVHEDLILELARAGLRVINPSSVTRYAETDLTTRDIATELSVDGIVQGRTHVAQGQMALELALIDGDTDEIVWTGEFQETLGRVKVLYHRVTEALAEETGVRLSAETLARLAETQEVDPQVYDALLQARYHWQQLTEAGLDRAEDYYRLALSRDSTAAEAWFGIGQVWLGRAQMGFVSSQEAQRQADPALAQARELDPELAGVQAQLAPRRVWSQWDWTGGKVAFERALEADPNDSVTRAYFSQLLLYLNEDTRALEEIRRATELDPFNTLVRGLYAMDLNFLHRPEEAEAVLASVPDGEADLPIVLSTLRTTYHLLGRRAEAMDMWRASYQASGDEEALTALEDGWKSGGYSEALRSVADLLVRRSEAGNQYVTPWQIATLYTRAGDGAPALDYLELAMEARDQNMPYISIDPIFDFLREEPRFRTMLDRLGLEG